MRKEKVIIFGVLVVLTVIMFTGCKTDLEENNPFAGTFWKGNDGSEISFSSTGWLVNENKNYIYRGTYTYSENIATMKVKEYRFYNESKWYPYEGTNNTWSARINKDNTLKFYYYSPPRSVKNILNTQRNIIGKRIK
jgi:hypothetical protein